MSNLNAKAVEIALKRATGSNQRVLPSNINQIIQAEYACKYLELIGAYPTRYNCDYLLDNLPVDEALIVPLWAREQIIVVPGMTEKEAEATNLFSIPKDHMKEEKKEDKTETNTPTTGILGNINGKPTPLKSGKRKLSWATVDSVDKIATLACNLGTDDVRSEEFKKMIIPLSFTEEQLTKPVSLFCASIVDFMPRIRLDKTGKVYDNLLRLLSLTSSLKLFSLMTHYVYWNIIHPFARNALISVGKISQTDPNVNLNRFDVERSSMHEGASLTSSAYQNIDLMSETSLNDREKEILFVQLESCLLKIHKGIGYSKQALQSAYQALVSSCHFVVDELLSAIYPWLSNINVFRSNNINKDFAPNEVLSNIKLQLRRFIHQSIADIIDPSRIYTAAFISTSKEPGAKPPKTSKGGFYCTSAATKAIFGDSKNSDTRRMLNSYTTLPYTVIPGAVDPAFAKKKTPQMIPDLGIDPKLLKKFLDDDGASSLSSMSVRSLDDIPLHNFGFDPEGFTDNNKSNINDNIRSFSAINLFTSNNIMNSPIRTPNSPARQLPPVSRTMSSPVPIKDGKQSKFTSEIHQIVNNSKNMRSRNDLDQSFTNQKRDVLDDLKMKKEVLKKQINQSDLKKKKIPSVNYKNLFDHDFSKDDKERKSSKSSLIESKNKNNENKLLDLKEVLDTVNHDELYEDSIGSNDESIRSNTSMAQNKNAQIQLSMKSKTSLMNLLLERTGSLYSERNIGSQFGKTLGAKERQNLLLDKNEKTKYFYIKTDSTHKDETAYYIT